MFSYPPSPLRITNSVSLPPSVKGDASFHLSLSFTGALHNNIIQANLPFHGECLGESLHDIYKITQKKNPGVLIANAFTLSVVLNRGGITFRGSLEIYGFYGSLTSWRILLALVGRG